MHTPILRRHALGVLAAVLTLSSCQSTFGLSETQVLQVAEVRAKCHGPFPMECLLVWNQATGEWNYFYSEIAGFEHEWGTRYVLRVERREVRDPRPDASSSTYSLVQVMASETSPHADQIARIRATEAQWASVAAQPQPTRYSMTLERICDCQTLRLLHSRVTRHAASLPDYQEHADSINVVATGQRISAGPEYGFGTIWGLFGLLYIALVSADQVDVEFDDVLGYPRVIHIDGRASVFGDEVTLRVHALEFD